MFDDISPMDSPRAQLAMEQLVEEVVEHAIDTLQNGSTAERNALMKMVLGEILRSKQDSGSVEAEKILAEARAMIGGMMPGMEDG